MSAMLGSTPAAAPLSLTMGRSGRLALLAHGALGVWMGVHAIRAYSAAVVWIVSREATSAQQVGAAALAAYILGLFAWVVTRVVARGRPLEYFGVLLALLVTGRQALQGGPAGVMLAMAAAIAWLWWLQAFLDEASRPGAAMVVPSLLAGLAAQVAGQTALHGLDLTVLPSAAGGLLLSAAFVGTILWLTRGSRAGRESGRATWGAGWGAATLGPYLFLQFTLLTNLGRLQVVSGWALPAVALVINLALLAALVCLRWSPRRPARLGLAVLVAAGLMPGEWMAGWFVLALIPIQAALAALLAAACEPRRGGGAAVLYTAAAAGMLLFFVLGFLFGAGDLFLVLYIAHVPVPWTVLWPVAALLVAIAALRAPPALPYQDAPKVQAPAAVIGAATLAGLSLGFALSPAVMATPAIPATMGATGARPAEIKVLSYNVHQGFDIRGAGSAPAIADVIAAADADLVALQEVNRGLEFAGGADLVAYLRWRLPQYQVVFGPTFTSIMGNVIMSRYRVRESGWGQFPHRPGIVPYGYTWATLDGPSGDLLLVSTHLTAYAPLNRERTVQADTLVRFWDRRPLTILAGDFNAQPGEETISRLLAGGLIDVPAAVDQGHVFTFPAGRPSRRIDYVFSSSDLHPVAAAVLTSTASDHLPVLVTIRQPD